MRGALLGAALVLASSCAQQGPTRSATTQAVRTAALRTALAPSAACAVGDCFDLQSLDLRLLLPDAPSNDSATTRAEIVEMLRFQSSRSQQQCDDAAADVPKTPVRFAAALGLPADFKIQSTPSFKRLSDRLLTLEEKVLAGVKSAYARPRPFNQDSRLAACIDKPTSGSYPSGHSTWAMMMALILVDMVPERRAQLLQRETEYANNRVVGGVHFPSDVAAGKTAGTLIAALLLANPGFRSDEAAARRELRAALGLP